MFCLMKLSIYPLRADTFRRGDMMAARYNTGGVYA